MKFDSSSDSDFEPISAKQSCTRPVRVVLSSSSDEVYFNFSEDNHGVFSSSLQLE